MLAARMKREMSILAMSPPAGISCYPAPGEGDPPRVLLATVLGTPGTVNEGGTFTLEVGVPARYPMEPPRVKFVTPLYHPNVDDAGRICLDLLKAPPAGSWSPASNLSTVLQSVQLLMNEPNCDDALMPDIAAQFRQDHEAFDATARRWVAEHACEGASAAGPAAAAAAADDDDDVGAAGPARDAAAAPSAEAAPAPRSSASAGAAVARTRSGGGTGTAPEEPSAPGASSSSRLQDLDVNAAAPTSKPKGGGLSLKKRKAAPAPAAKPGTSTSAAEAKQRRVDVDGAA